MSKTIIDKMNDGREYRNVYEVRAADDEQYIVDGYATVFNEPYVLFRDGEYTFSEVIDADAFSETDMSDVIMQYDHEGRVFARISNETLAVSPDEHGLHVRAYLGGTDGGRDLYDEIKGGYITKMSFGFTVAKDEQTVTTDENGATDIVRRVLAVKRLFDVSAVSIPANDATNISARNAANGAFDAVKAERQRAEQIERKRKELELRLRLIERN